MEVLQGQAGGSTAEGDVRQETEPRATQLGRASLDASGVVTVVGTGTIGEPLIGILADYKDRFGISDVIFVKRTPNLAERAKIRDLVGRGAALAVFPDRDKGFRDIGIEPQTSYDEAIQSARVIIDCTPAGNANKFEIYQNMEGNRRFIAQGSEHGFGAPYARGINDIALVDGDSFVQVVSCNTHAISALVQTLGMTDGENNLVDGDFTVMRRASDIGQDDGFVPSPAISRHDDEQFGTHHARDAHELFKTIGHDLELFSSAVKLPTQYKHLLRFRLTLDREISLDEVEQRLAADHLIATTHHRTTNKVFSFGRDHGLFGRLLTHAVVPLDGLAVRGDKVYGTAFTPQDGNSLLSSIAATLKALDPETAEERLSALEPYIFREI